MGRDEQRLALIMWAVYVLLGLVHVAADPVLHADPLLPAARHVKLLQAMFVRFLALVLIICVRVSLSLVLVITII